MPFQGDTKRIHNINYGRCRYFPLVERTAFLKQERCEICGDRIKFKTKKFTRNSYGGLMVICENH